MKLDRRSGFKEKQEGGNDGSEFDPVLSQVPLLPLRDVIVFPHMVVPLFVGREKSIHALEECVAEKKDLLLVAQKSATVVTPAANDLFSFGTIGQILQMFRLPDNTVKVLVEGKQRAKVVEFYEAPQMLRADLIVLEEGAQESVEAEALMRSLKSTFENYVKLNKKIPPEVGFSIHSIENPSRLSDLVVPQLSLKLEDKQEVLEAIHPVKRLEKVLQLMQAEIEILQVERRIRSRVKRQMEKSQKEYYLNEQMQAIQKELGEKDEFKAEIQAIEKQIRSQPLSKEAKEKITRELKKLKWMSPISAEAAVLRNYIDWVIQLPWNEFTQDSVDLAAASRLLEEDHYGLEDVKERILEYLSVRLLLKKSQGQILCFAGPPGVGKTSLAKSIAKALGKKFVRCSLGGVRDEAEIRGHRRTYVGALPGKMIQSLKKAGSSNPVFLLDEVDKMSMDFRGDPSSALLEVLDPEQNVHFSDHYLELDYDLSQVLFILTANSLHHLPKPLLDRMEVISVSGYTLLEKEAIAKKYLIPKQRETHGLKLEDLSLSTGAIRSLIQHYTREAGVRNLERMVATACRKVARRLVEKREDRLVSATGSLEETDLEILLGPPKFLIPAASEVGEVGVANGLAYTDAGGELLQIEVSVVPGKSQVKVTGKLGEVMQESAATAMTYVRSRAIALGLNPDFYQQVDIHLHVPEGAVPKDGPSAGITMATAIASALLRLPVKRAFAMTGEITLRGRVLPIGGLKEKLLAAKTAGMTHVIIPFQNQADLKKVPADVQEGLVILPVSHADEVLRQVLEGVSLDTFLVSPVVNLPVPGETFVSPPRLSQ